MIQCHDLNLPHPRRNEPLFEKLRFTVEEGSWAEVTGESGCGKSLLFQLLGLRLKPVSGQLIVGGCNVNRLNPKQLARLRQNLGSCEQNPTLLQNRSVLENVLLPFLVRNDLANARQRAEQLLEHTQLSELRDVPVRALTHSEMRRVGILRAIAGQPKLVLIDGGVEDLSLEDRKRFQHLLQHCLRQGSAVVLFARQYWGGLTGRGIHCRLDTGQMIATSHSTFARSPETVGPYR